MTAAPTVGVVGLGCGRAHIPAFQAHGCPVVAVCQRDSFEDGLRAQAVLDAVRESVTRRGWVVVAH